MFSLEGKVAVVTGGASGIGEATVRRFAAAGATCAVVDVADGATLAKEIGGSAHLVDVTDADAVAKMLEGVIQAHGNLDILVNNAGIMGPAAGLLADDLEDAKQVLDVNLMGVAYGVRAAARLMAPGGSIVNTASMAGVVGFPGLAWYGMSKHAVVGLTKNAAIELGPLGIRVNCVCPTGIQTPMADDPELEHWASASMALGNQHVRRLGTASEVAAAIHFLASDDASMVNGHALYVDGGMAAGMSDQLIESSTGESIHDGDGYS